MNSGEQGGRGKNWPDAGERARRQKASSEGKGIQNPVGEEKAHLEVVSLAGAFGFQFQSIPTHFSGSVYVHPTLCSYMKESKRDDRSLLLYT